VGTYGRLRGSGGSGNTILTRAQTLLGSTITKVMGTDFDNDQWYRTSLSGTGSVTPSVTERGGVITLSSGGSASGSAYILPHGTIDLLDNAATSRWYATWRTKITTAVDSAAGAEFRLATAVFGNPQLLFGYTGSISTGFFSYLMLNSGGSTTATGVTTVALDTSYHVFEIYSDTTTLTMTIDGVIVATTASSNAPAGVCTPMLNAYNGATATTRSNRADYLYLCCAEPS
jgi:hypothetical protein